MTLNGPPNGGIAPRTIRPSNVDNQHPAYSNVQQGWSTDDRNRDREPLYKPRYPHIKDLQARADATISELSAVMPVCSGWYTSSRLEQYEMLLGTSNPRHITDSYPSGSCTTISKSGQHQCHFQEAGSCIYGVPRQL